MSAGGDFRHDAAETRVQIRLRGDDAGENPRLVGEDGGGGFVTGSFDGEKKSHDCFCTVGRLKYRHDHRTITTAVFRQAVSGV